MKYLDDPATRQEMVEALEASKRGATYVVRVKVTTRGIGAHRPARTLCVWALQKGLKVQYDHDGGWLVRRHAITVEGNPREAISFKLIAQRLYQAVP